MFIDIILINRITIPENGVGGDDELGLLISLNAALFVEADDGVAQRGGTNCGGGEPVAGAAGRGVRRRAQFCRQCRA